MPRSSAILIGNEHRYFGKFLGFVKETDAKETLKLRRIRALVPEIDPAEWLEWALPCDSVKRDWLPVVGDVVWIEFRGGFVDLPIWVGLAVSKDDVSSDFLANYVTDYRRDTDPSGNEVEWTSDGGTSSDKAIKVNGDKTLATKDYVDWIQSDLIAWLKTHKHTGNQGAPTPLFPADLATLNTKDATYTTNKGAGGGFLTDHLKGG